ncbi:polysaccharide deacetylase family protein [Plebeiibacterium sediminum]|uniref:Polysaccharide deacetylase family protein n=1 Tax=Plebeiibacterium sediminum TaxID=2992112 RepID=A0AAE3M2E7_9BACT|nr:polysaccharide deacetylase family protein [Plebeiobacterium sediminum]MCW3785555.1 polysaccharide deacetylase family protein [Plebeiobacterium sediminum]
MKFRVFLFIYIGVVLGILLLNITLSTKLIWIAITTLFFSGIIALGVSVMRLNFFIQSRSNIYTEKKEIALTFDDGPDQKFTPQILDLLKEFNAKATFFCIGSKVKGQEDILKRMIEEGHAIGNHTFEHANSFPWWSVTKIKESIKNTDKALKEAGLEATIMFRPPFGVTNNIIATAIKQSNKKCVGWSIRTKDTCKSVAEVVNKVKKKLKAGDIILLHDTNSNILVELREILVYCKKHNFTPVALNNKEQEI